MAKKNHKLDEKKFGYTEPSTAAKRAPFYFGKDNYRLMLIGLGLIIAGFIMMMGRDANTRPDGVFDTNYWNDGIFSIWRVRIAPLLVIAGFVVEVFAILKSNKQSLPE